MTTNKEILLKLKEHKFYTPNIKLYIGKADNVVEYMEGREITIGTRKLDITSKEGILNDVIEEIQSDLNIIHERQYNFYYDGYIYLLHNILYEHSYSLIRYGKMIKRINHLMYE